MTTSGGAITSGARWLQALCAALVLAVAAAWATASAPGSSPDDDFHLASIWCAWGQDAAGCTIGATPESGHRTVSVPALSIQAATCTAFQPEVSAACAWVGPDGSPRDLTPETYPLRANNGSYPGGFYGFLRLFVVDSAATSVMLMRTASALVCLVLLLTAGLLTTGGDRWRLWQAWLVASVPLGVFIFASTNPSGVAVAGSAAVLPLTLAALRATSVQRQWIAAGSAAGAALIALSARTDAAYFVGLAVVVALLAGLRSGRNRLVRQLVLLVPIGIVLAATFLTRNAGALAVGGAEGVTTTEAPSAQNFLSVLSFYLGDFATRLGWLDVPMPPLAWGSMALALGALLGHGIGGVGPRRALGAGLLLTVAVALPLIMLERTGYRVGEWVQARYLLPVVLLLVGLLSLTSVDHGRPPNRRQLLWVAALASLAHALALHVTLRRYITGTDVAAFDLNAGMEWWWDVPIQPMTVWWLGTVAFTALAVLVSMRAGDPKSAEHGTHTHVSTGREESITHAPA